MKLRITRKLIAVTGLILVSACGGGSGSFSTPNVTPSAPALTSRIVGIGDSLTAGYQAGGFLGQFAPPVPNPNPGAPFPIVPPGQESGFWSLLYQQATGQTWISQANPQGSVLPLIAGPGLANELVTAGPTSPLPFAASKPNGCQSNDLAGFSSTLWTNTRLNPSATTLDLAVPGITMHEAIAMNQPLAPTCAPIPGISPTVAGLLAVVNGESSLFYPVLGRFSSTLGKNLTELNAAVSLKPTLATIWLGANDLLKYTFTGGQFCLGDSTHMVGGTCAIDTSGAQVQTDMTTIITALQKTGAKVVVANLPNVLKLPQFASVAAPPAPAACALQTYLVCVYEGVLTPLLIAKGDPNAQADAQAAATAITAYIAATYGLAPNGYVNETGAITALQQALNPATGQITVSNINLDPNGPGTGLGALYLTPTFAAAVQSYNDTINAGIATAAGALGVPVVPVRDINDGIASGSGPYFLQAVSINPAPNPRTGAPFTCCSLAFGFGLLSFDGLHPSNTGYALIASAFIQTIDSAYGASIPQVNPQAVYQGTGPNAAFPDPYAPH
ncbi:MAG: SGNH/GDSL hydrolase family protein [Candidatus Eremiobacteraeota bacterium]|nr:SGNH/GDSL hydrolase family protein [Candidatus Eremiobacteraeota bacterium]